MNHTILIIEDDDFLRSLAVAKLEKEGFTVRMAANGQEGLDQLRQGVPDLLILDLMLPMVSGFDILKTVRSEPTTSQLKVIVFSNMGDEADIKTCLDLGITDYLVKANFTLDELVDKIKTVLV
jgi:DNA-binding response OmpR family regulator